MRTPVSLDVSLGVTDGEPTLVVRDQNLDGGWVLHALELRLDAAPPSLETPEDLARIAATDTSLLALDVELPLAVLAQRLDAGFLETRRPLRKVALTPSKALVQFDAELLSSDRASTIIAELGFGIGAENDGRRELLCVVGEVLELGVSSPWPATLLPAQLAAALQVEFARVLGLADARLRRRGPCSVAFDPLVLFARVFAEVTGHRVPCLDRAQLVGVSVEGSALRLVARAAGAEVASPAPEVSALLRREETVPELVDLDPILERGELEPGYRAVSARLVAGMGPPLLLERLLSVGTSSPEVRTDALELAEKLVRRDPLSLQGLLAKARVSAGEGDLGTAFELTERVARLLREGGRRRSAGLAYRAASRVARDNAERVRVLEEAIALLPDDLEALSGLAEALPGLGRASAAVRAARRLATIAESEDVRVRAHTLAGDLLRGPLADPMQARREYERALKLAPDDAHAVEGLARTLVAQGDLRRAVALLEASIEKAGAENATILAARLSRVLGDLLHATDVDGALASYKRAANLDPSSLGPLLRLASIAREAHRREVALEAVELALARTREVNGIGSRAERLELDLLAGALFARVEGREADAIERFEAALELDPNQPDALQTLADLYRKRGKDPRLEKRLGALARQLVARGDFDGAARLFRERAELVRPSVRDAWSETFADPPADAIEAREVLADIRRGLKEALEKADHHAPLLDVLVDVSELQDDPSGLVEAIDRRLLLEDAPRARAELLTRFGAALERLGRISDAVRAYEEAVVRDARSARAIEALVRIHRSKDDPARLAATLERAAALREPGPDRASLLAERARLLASLARDEEALTAVLKALDDVPDDLEALALATHLSLRLRRFGEARAFLDRRLERVEPSDTAGKIAIHLEIARAAEGIGDQGLLVRELEAVLALVGLESPAGRDVGLRLAGHLQAAGRTQDLATLERRLAATATTRVERAERLLHAGRLALGLQDRSQAEADLRDALAIADAPEGPEDRALGTAKALSDIRKVALETLEAIARRDTDARPLAEILARRARAASSVDEKERLRLEQVRVLEVAGLEAAALKVLEEVVTELPNSLALARGLGDTAARAKSHALAAEGYARAARLAAAAHQDHVAIEMYARAAEASLAAGDVRSVAELDRALLLLAPPGTSSPSIERALDRLERHARESGEAPLLIEALNRRALVASPTVAVRLLLEKASLERDRLGDERSALESLRRARTLAPQGSELRETIDDHLVEALGRLGQLAEQAALLFDRAELATRPERQSELYLQAALVSAGPLGDRALALSRVSSAIRAFPQNAAARALRLKLLREGGRREALVDALEDEAAAATDPADAARAWLDAAEMLLPNARHVLDDGADKPPRHELERALDLVRRASSATPSAAEPLRMAAAYARLLGRGDEEFVALEQLVEREVPEEERVAAYLRRADLLRGPLDDARAASQELDVALAVAEDLDPDARARVADLLPSRTALYFELRKLPLVIGVLRAGIELASDVGDHEREVKLLLRLVEMSEDARARSELRTRAGEVIEWKLGDAAAAEREYLAAVAIDATNSRAREVLRSFYVASDRFGDLAENMGIDTLREVWERMRLVETPARVAAAGEALWTLLPAGSVERAEVQLRLADIYATAKNDPAQVVHLLELVTREAPLDHQRQALERLSVLFLEQERYDLYVDVLRRQAERIEDDKGRARAFADIGDALEWKVGDGPAAEREYRAALAIDPSCKEAHRRLAVLLASQDRFAELGQELGAQTLAEELDRLAHQGARERDRAWRAIEALSRLLEPDRRGTAWLRFADRLRGEEGERAALERAAVEGGPDEIRVLDRLIALLEGAGDVPAIANALRRRVSLEKDAERRTELHYRLGSVLYDMVGAADAQSRAALAAESESELRAVLRMDAGHAPARLLLKSLYVADGQLVRVGQVLGREALLELRDRAEEENNRVVLERSTEALVELSSGPERATYALRLLELLADSPDLQQRHTPESLYRAALQAEPNNGPAQEGLRAIYEAEGRYREIGDALGVEALRDSVIELEQLQDRAGLLPAALALAHALADVPGTDAERIDLWMRIAGLHARDDDKEAAEHALREVLALAPAHPAAREDLRRALVAEGRLVELAQIDELLVEHTASLARDQGDMTLELQSLRVLADRRTEDARADLLVMVAELELRRGRFDEAESALRLALLAQPDHGLAQVELERLLWRQRRLADIIDTLGAQVLLSRVHVSIDAEPDACRDAIALLLERQSLDPNGTAEAHELAARVAEDGDTRLSYLLQAAALYDQLKDRVADERVRIAIAHLHRERGDVDALIEALGDALAHALSPEVGSALAIERATLLILSDRLDEARTLVTVLVEEEDVPRRERIAAARILTDDLSPASPEDVDRDQLPLYARALELATVADSPDHDGRDRRLVALATARELMGDSGAAVAEPLEAALECLEDASQELPIRRRLRALYEEVGDWARAERHAAVIAATENRAEEWVSVSELRVWLDDRLGAKEALENAVALKPGFNAAHSALVELRERDGDKTSLIDALSSWAENDRSSSRVERAERFLRAARLAVEANDTERAAILAERAVDVARDPEIAERVALDAAAILEPLGQRQLIALLYGCALAAGASSSRLRIKLADELAALGRTDEASTVLEQGLKRQMPEEDPLLLRFIADTGALPDDTAARRLLALADRLGAGPAARRLRVAGAERAERAGEKAMAVTAWSHVADDLGAKASSVHARRSQIRLAREIGDLPTLVTALVMAADEAESNAERGALLAEAAELSARMPGNAVRAEALLRRAVSANPEDEGLVSRLFDLIEREGRFAELDDELQARAQTKEGEARAALLDRRARLARDRGRDLGRAVPLLAEAYAARPTLERALAYARALLAVGRVQEASGLLGELKRDAREAPPQLLVECTLLRADAAEATGARDEAIDALSEARRLAPDSELIEARLVALLSRSRRHRELATALDGWAARAEPSRGMRLCLAAARLLIEEVKDPQAAKEVLTRALAIAHTWSGGPEADMPERSNRSGLGEDDALKSGSPLVDLAELARSIGAHGLAIDALRLRTQALAVGPAQWRSLLALAAAERAAGDLEAAELTLRGLVEAERRHSAVSPGELAEAEDALGLLLLERSRAEGAVEALTRAIELYRRGGPASVKAETRALLGLARAQRACGRGDLALAALRDAHALDPAAISEAEFEAAIEEGGAPHDLAEMFERRAKRAVDRTVSAELSQRAASIWESAGERDRALGARIAAFFAASPGREEARALVEDLYRADRYEDLERVEKRRLEIPDLSDGERVAIVLSRARVLHTRLGRGREALAALAEARELMPKSRELLVATSDLSAELGEHRAREDALQRLAAMERSPERKRALLAERALVLEALGEIERAEGCLEEAFELVIQERRASLDDEVGLPRSLIDRLAAVYEARGNFTQLARLWVRVAEVCSGNEAAAALSRAGHVRHEKLGDQRGAMAAFEAAARQNPEDLGIRRALIDLALQLGDLSKARVHVRAGLEFARQNAGTDAMFSLLVEEARIAVRLSDPSSARAAWAWLLRAKPEHPGLLELLVHEGRSLFDADLAVQLLKESIAALPEGPTRARHRRARAELLDHPLLRPREAEAEREAARRESALSEPGAKAARPAGQNGHDAGSIPELVFRRPPTRDGAEVDEDRTLRSALDRAGRFDELATLEEKRAAQLTDPLARASALVEIARLHAEARVRGSEERDPAGVERARAALERALETFPDNLQALARLARLEVERGDPARAREPVERLERLGGPPWPVPSFEILGARLAAAEGDEQLGLSRLLRARERDPRSIEALSGLARYAVRRDGVEANGWVHAFEAVVDPVAGRAKLAELRELQAGAALQAGHLDDALSHLTAALELEPNRRGALELRRRVVSKRPNTRALGWILLEEAELAEPERAPELFARALDAAASAGDRASERRIAERIEGRLSPGHPLFARVVEIYAEAGDGERLLALAGRLGGALAFASLSPATRRRLAELSFEAGRARDTLTILVSFLPRGAAAPASHAGRSKRGPTPELLAFARAIVATFGAYDTPEERVVAALASPRVIAGVERLLDDLRHAPDSIDERIALLEGMSMLLPEERGLRRLLATLHRERPGGHAASAKILRGLLAEDPLDRELVVLLIETLVASGASESAAGPRAVLALLGGEAALPPEARAVPPLRPIRRSPRVDLVREHLLRDELATPLGRLLARGARAVATVLPKPERATRVPAAHDPRVALVAEGIGRLIDIEIETVIDPEGGQRVKLEPGDPPDVALGEALVAGSSPAELAFHIARASMLIQLGHLLVEETAAARRRAILELLLVACDPSLAVEAADFTSEGHSVVERLRTVLGPAGLAECEPLARKLQGRDPHLGAWMSSAVATANRFALLAAGDLQESVRALLAVDPRAIGERLDSAEARVRMLRRSPEAVELIAFALSEAFEKLAKDGSREED